MSPQKHLKRLDRIYTSHPVYFLTVCTFRRCHILATPEVSTVLLSEWRSASKRHGWLIGRYVIMPDHVHFFCSERPDCQAQSLSRFMNHWKEWSAKGIVKVTQANAPIWQREFFDHVLRHDESYAEKWSYVRENPVRANLVDSWEQWPHQGFIDFDSPLLR